MFRGYTRKSFLTEEGPRGIPPGNRHNMMAADTSTYGALRIMEQPLCLDLDFGQLLYHFTCE